MERKSKDGKSKGARYYVSFMVLLGLSPTTPLVRGKQLPPHVLAVD